MSSEHSAPTTDLCRMAVLLIVDLALNSLFFADFYSLRARINCWEHDTLLKDLTTKNFSRSTIKEPTQPHSMLKLVLRGHFLGSKMKLQKSSLSHIYIIVEVVSGDFNQRQVKGMPGISYNHQNLMEMT